MRQNVTKRYVVTLLDAEDLIATTVRDVLDPRAPDTEIVEFAVAHDWVVFTSDDDFFELADRCGCIYYHQPSSPAVGDVLAAVQAIRRAYDDYSDIVEVVPGNWV